MVNIPLKLIDVYSGVLIFTFFSDLAGTNIRGKKIIQPHQFSEFLCMVLFFHEALIFYYAKYKWKLSKNKF